MNFIRNQFMKVRMHLSEDDGIGVVEMILILVVLVALVVVFKSQLNTLVTNIFNSINTKSATIYK